MAGAGRQGKGPAFQTSCYRPERLDGWFSLNARCGGLAARNLKHHPLENKSTQTAFTDAENFLSQTARNAARQPGPCVSLLPPAGHQLQSGREAGPGWGPGRNRRRQASGPCWSLHDAGQLWLEELGWASSHSVFSPAGGVGGAGPLYR